MSRTADAVLTALAPIAWGSTYAVTTQWLSLNTKTLISRELDLGPGARILEVTRHENKLRTGHLHGNRFEVVLTGAADGDERILGERLETLAREQIRQDVQVPSGYWLSWGGQF